MENLFNLDELNQFCCSEQLYQHWLNRMLIYTDGVKYLAERLNCYWLIEEFACVILPQLRKNYPDCFYSIKFCVKRNCSATISIDDGNGKIHFKHKINWTDFPKTGKAVKFYLCLSGNQYCLMLPSEY